MNKYLAFGIVAIFLIVGGWWYFSQSNVPVVPETTQLPPTDQPTQPAQSPTPVWRILHATTNFNNGNPISYTVEYPSDWTVETKANSHNDKSLSFVLEGEKYALAFLTAGTGVPGEFDQVKDEKITLADKRFNKKSFIRDNNVVLVSYIVLDYPAPFEGVFANVPIKDNASYVALYERVLGTLKYPVQ